jgi:chromosomal replication initiator protein
VLQHAGLCGILVVRDADRTLDEVVDAVAAYYGFSVEEIVSGPAVYQRCIAKHLALRVTRHSLPQIGRYFGGVHSNNVLHASRIIERDMLNDPIFGAQLLMLKASLVMRS